MGRLNRRLERVEDGEQERAAREVRRIVAAIPDDELLELHGFPAGDVEAVPPPEGWGLSWALIWPAIGGKDVPDAEARRRLGRLLRPMHDRIFMLRKQRGGRA